METIRKQLEEITLFLITLPYGTGLSLLFFAIFSKNGVNYLQEPSGYKNAVLMLGLACFFWLISISTWLMIKSYKNTPNLADIKNMFDETTNTWSHETSSVNQKLNSAYYSYKQGEKVEKWKR